MELVDPEIEAYAEQVTSPHEELLAELSAETIRDSVGPASMLTGPVAGRFLELLVWGMQPRRVLEIGTLTGHSALAMAAALPDDGHLDACELDPGAGGRRAGQLRPLTVRLEDHAARRARARHDRAARGNVRLRLPRRRQGRVRRLLRSGRAAAERARADRRRQHARSAARVLDGEGPIVRFNDHVAADPRTVQVLLTVRDGITLIRRA